MFPTMFDANDQIKKNSISQKKDGILITDENEIGKFVSNQFRRLFITYTMAINKQENRTGSLFDKNFKRLEITDNEYFIFYFNNQMKMIGKQTISKNRSMFRNKFTE